MIYSLSFDIEGVYGPGGYAGESLPEVIGFATPLAVVALDHLGDGVSEMGWFNVAGEEANPRELLEQDEPRQVAHVVSQISDALKCRDMGHIDISTHETLLDLVEDQDVLSWCSGTLRNRIELLKIEQASLLTALVSEWAEV